MRRAEREISDFQEMLQVLKECDCCRIGLMDEQGAYIVPMNFGYEIKGERLFLFFHGAKEGKKIDLIRAQKRAGFEMDCRHELMEGAAACAYSYFYQSIMGNGTVEILEDREEKKHGLGLVMEKYTQKRDWEFVEAAVDRVAVFKMEVTSWSCKQH